MTAQRIGLIAPSWLPNCGGGEQYEHRLAQALKKRGWEIKVFAGTPEREGEDNGSIKAKRFGGNHGFMRRTWQNYFRKGEMQALREMGQHYAFNEAAACWVKAEGLRLVLVGTVYGAVRQIEARELYAQLKTLGVYVGVLQYDLAEVVSNALVKIYRDLECTWEEAAKRLEIQLKKVLQREGELAAYYTIGSSLFFRPDFVVTCSKWVARFVDPCGVSKVKTLHPLIESEYWSTLSGQGRPLARRTILMVNPQGRKNPQAMAELMVHGSSEWTFRVLKGGWGDGFAKFEGYVARMGELVTRRIEKVDYVSDMRMAYRAADLVFFPSLLEGYGMTAVEPMFQGVPVVSSNYPAVLEAVGDGAATFCPYRSTRKERIARVAEVLANPEQWRERSLERSQYLARRQETELAEMESFLNGYLES